MANDLGLLAEEFDSGESRQTGNFPQALTHIALINTAHNLSDAKKSAEKPVVQRDELKPHPEEPRPARASKDAASASAAILRDAAKRRSSG